MKKVTQHMGEPVDRLSRIARRMTEAMENDPERGEERAIVILTTEGGECTTHSHGYEPEQGGKALTDLLMHARALGAAMGINLDVLFAPEKNQG